MSIIDAISESVRQWSGGNMNYGDAAHFGKMVFAFKGYVCLVMTIDWNVEILVYIVLQQ